MLVLFVNFNVNSIVFNNSVYPYIVIFLVFIFYFQRPKIAPVTKKLGFAPSREDKWLAEFGGV